MELPFRLLDLGRRPFDAVRETQKKLYMQRKAGETCDTVILVEHEPVYTMGRTALEENITASEEELAAFGIEVVQTSRGGDVTYHGPGQLVVYPIVHLGDLHKGILWYIIDAAAVLLHPSSPSGLRRDKRACW